MIARRFITLRRAAVVAAAIVATLAAVALAAPYVLRGPRLGQVIGWALPPLRGQVRVGGGTWTWGALWALMRGRPGPFVLDDVLLTDPDGARVFQARQVAAAVEVDRKRNAVVLHDLRVTDAFWRMAETKDRRGIGFLAVFERAPTTKVATGPKPSSPSTALAFAINGARLQNLDAEFDLPGWALTLRNLVSEQGNLAIAPDAQGHAVFTFEVTNALARGGGRIAVLDGARRLRLPFSTVQLARVATTALAPDAIELDARAIETASSVSSLRGRFTRVFGRGTGPPAAALAVGITDAADAVAAVAGGHPELAGLAVSGRGATLTFSINGPLAAPLIVADAQRFDLKLRGLSFGGVAFHLDSQPTARLVRLTGFTFDSPAGGRVTIDGTLDHLLARCRLRFERFVGSPYLPAPLLPFAGGTLDGHVRAEADLGHRRAGIDDTDLFVTRPPQVAGPPVVHIVSEDTGPVRRSRRALATTLRFNPTHWRDGTLSLPRVTSMLWGGRVTARGRLRLWDPNTSDWMPSPWFVVKLDATRIAFERLIGSDFVVGTVSLQAQARGTLQALALEASFAPHQRLRILGDWFTLPPTIVATVDTTAVTVPPLLLRGQAGSALGAQGRLELSGGLAMDIDVVRFPLRKLPGLADIELPLDGQVQGQLRLSGARGAPAVAGRLSIVDARFQDRPIGGGTLTISPSARGGIRARGQVIEGMTADGTLTPARGGALGEVTLTLRQLRLDPFLGGLPGGLTAAGILSGSVKARVAPGAQPSVDGRLSELALLVTGPPLPAPALPQRTAQPVVDFHAESEVHLTAQANGGAIVLAPARFAGRAGTLELSGETKGGAAKGLVRGHLDLNQIGELAKPWVDRMAGTVDFEVAAAVPAAGARATLRGSVAVTTPVRVRLRHIPIDAGLSPGRIVLTENGATTRDLPVTLGRHTIVVSGQLARAPDGPPRLAVDLRGALDPRLIEPFARTVVRDVDGKIGVSARVEGPVTAPAVRARLNVADTAFTLVEGRQRLQVPRGAITLTMNASERLAELRNVEVRMGNEVRAVVGAQTEPARAGLDGRLRVASDDLLEVIAVDLPARGTVHALATPDVIVDDATFALRLTGNPQRQLRLSGDVEVGAAHVPERLRNRKKPPVNPAAPRSPASALLERTQLDVRLHSRKGAVSVELDHAPDLSVDVDFKLGGTLAQPRPEGSLKPAGVYSRIVLFLAGLFK